MLFGIYLDFLTYSCYVCVLVWAKLPDLNEWMIGCGCLTWCMAWPTLVSACICACWIVTGLVYSGLISDVSYLVSCEYTEISNFLFTRQLEKPVRQLSTRDWCDKGMNQYIYWFNVQSATDTSHLTKPEETCLRLKTHGVENRRRFSTPVCLQPHRHSQGACPDWTGRKTEHWNAGWRCDTTYGSRKSTSFRCRSFRLFLLAIFFFSHFPSQCLIFEYCVLRPTFSGAAFSVPRFGVLF